MVHPDEKILKLLLISPLPPPSGGIQTVTETLVSYFRDNQNGTDITLYDNSHRLRPATSQSLLIRFLTGIENSLKTYMSVRKFVSRINPEIIHLSSSASLALIKDLLIVTLARRKKIPVIMHWHFGRIPGLILRDNWEWKLLRRVIRKSTVSIVLDSMSYNSLNNLGIRNIGLIPNPLPPDVEKKMMDHLSGRQSKSVERKNRGRVIFIGHIIKEKGVYDLAEACSQIPSVKELVFIGHYETSVKNELMRIASGRSGAEWLQLHGELRHNQVLDAICCSDLFVLPSYTEGFPMVIIEAMAMGCPVIATAVGAIPEMLAVEGENPCGICVPVRNIEKLKLAVSELIDDQVKRERLGGNGTAKVLKNYTLESIAKQYKTLWQTATYN
jgi:glycosyltransferase involved in cell wall biosynthesis